MQKTIKILNGPSREELFDGLRLFAEKRVVGFTIENNGREMNATVWLHKIGAEDGSGQSWNIAFSIPESFIKVPYPISLNKLEQVKSVTVKAYYSTKNRKGAIIVE